MLPTAPPRIGGAFLSLEAAQYPQSGAARVRSAPAWTPADGQPKGWACAPVEPVGLDMGKPTDGSAAHAMGMRLALARKASGGDVLSLSLCVRPAGGGRIAIRN